MREKELAQKIDELIDSFESDSRDINDVESELQTLFKDNDPDFIFKLIFKLLFRIKDEVKDIEKKLDKIFRI
ncbi:hypothetical protein [Thermoanaerobacterium sp. RBIITD]|uniref:hypothetical protein n=1 Tax=Thermoanaerobacterium sp. RBIITD TaxID=1550240 RepID=UPI000BB74989|nr:hypothetical protein [Thermoanaerobacterium sp. RBIITD]SNX54997.1 hypothetical protein SAMN05660242_2774 [Thermoanaerobacterium sp. RBIITD]